METKNIDEKPVSTTGLQSVRVRARHQSEVRLVRGDSSDSRISWQNLRTLKSLEKDETPERAPEDSEPFIIRIWHQFQEAIGNR